MEPQGHEPDPVDGLRMALLQQRMGRLQARLQFRTFGAMEGLLLAMLAIGVVMLANAGHGRSRIQYLVVGWALVVQAIGLWWSARLAAGKEVARLQQKISAMADSRDGKIIAAAASSARELLLRKP